MTMASTTIDGLLDRRVTLEQPAEGYRVAIDTVMLAAAVPALAGDRVLDMGCGVGGAMLCVACRVPGVAGMGIDRQGDLVELARRNIARNDFAIGLDARNADATQLPEDLRGAFDHVLINPPYHEQARHSLSFNPIKRAANAEKDGDLPLWIASAVAALRPSGTLTLIHRADRQDGIVSCLRSLFGDIDILPLLPKKGIEAKRILVRARKGAVFAERMCHALVLHKPDGGYTPEADEILRNAEALAFHRI